MPPEPGQPSSAPAAPGCKSTASVKVGRWTDEEQATFLEQLSLHQRDWKKIAAAIPTRTIVQVRTHAQKYFLALQNERLHKMNQRESPGSLTKKKSKSSPSTVPAALAIASPGFHMLDASSPSSPLLTRTLAPLSFGSPPPPPPQIPDAWFEDWRHEASPTSVDEIDKAKAVDWSFMKEYPFEVEPLPSTLAPLSRWIDEL
jgi:SHAQKYF class myb-like DNA-binding protein